MHHRALIAAVLTSLLSVAVGCSDDTADSSAAPSTPPTTEEETTTVPSSTTSTESTTTTTTAPPEREPSVEPAELEGPITAGTIIPPADPKPVDLTAIDYVEEEWFAGGIATSYRQVGERTADGRWDVEPAEKAPYRTRFVVRRPASPDDFSGVVVVEWLNVSAVEASPDWAYTKDAIIDAGAAWVGVSAQAFGINGGQSLIDTGSDEQETGSGGIKAADPERYGSLEHPGDAYAFDIWSQIGAALRSKQGEDVLGGADVQHIIAVGESQSAGFLTGYVNAVHPHANAYDGYFIHSRGSGAATLAGEPAIRGDEVGYQVRDDLDAPVIVFETETDVGPLLAYATARQDDSELIRVWEVPGTAHADAYLVGKEFSLCPGGINDGPQHWVAKAAVEALINWVVDGEAPPHAERISTEAPKSTTILRDDLGLAEGGIRTPSVDVPVSALSGESLPDAEILCMLFGSSTPFDAATLRDLYPTEADYLEQFDAALDGAIAAGFVREADRKAYAAEARAVQLPE